MQDEKMTIGEFAFLAYRKCFDDEWKDAEWSTLDDEQREAWDTFGFDLESDLVQRGHGELAKCAAKYKSLVKSVRTVTETMEQVNRGIKVLNEEMEYWTPED